MAKITVKLFASLSDYLPPGAKDNAVRVGMPEPETIGGAIKALRVPEGRCHLVLLNGVFVPPSRRPTATLSDGDTIAIWPPVAGG